MPQNAVSGGSNGTSGSSQRSRKRRSSSGSSAIATNDPLPFPKAFSYVKYDNGALLCTSAGSSSGINLLDLVNVYKLKKEPIPELIAIHHTSRMLLHVETLHSVGKILHNDAKVSVLCCVYFIAVFFFSYDPRTNSCRRSYVSSLSIIQPDNWVVSGKNGTDVTLVDFGRSVDLSKAGKGGKGDHLSVLFTGNEAAQDMACPAMRNEEPWCLETDAYGIVASSFLLLYGSHLDIVETADGKWTPTKKLRRYWEASLWNRIFRDLINGTSDELPALMETIRKEFDAYLDEGNRRSHVQALLAHQHTLLPTSK